MNFDKIKYLNFKIFLLFGFILLLVYLNSFKGAWHLDDTQNIITNTALHLQTLNWQSIKNTFFATPGGISGLYRPVACFTFALNWYIGGDNVFGYHMVNLLVHIITAFFLFLTIKLLLRTPRMEGIFSEKQIYFIAFFAALLWAIHPIQLQTVTYIVQRMASMAGMFCIMGIYVFLRGRFAHTKNAKVAAYVFCFICFILGVLSKENAVVFPFILILIHWIFFLNGKVSKQQKYFWLGSLAICIAAAMVIIIVYPNALNLIFKGYEIRFFTPWQRLLTESRVMFLYLYQIIWPLPSHFQIEHYISLSKSLISPISTLFAVFAIIAMLVWAFIKAGRWPLKAFAILFYFGCHVVESTIVPLELVFEHRNYLPSMFIGVPIVAGYLKLLKYAKEKKALKVLFVTIGVFTMFLLGVSTYYRNYVWHSEAGLSAAAVARYPQLSRSYVNLAAAILTSETDLTVEADKKANGELALKYIDKAFENNYFHRNNDIVNLYVNISKIYAFMGDYDKAIEVALQTLEMFPTHFPLQQHIFTLYLVNNEKEKAAAFYEGLINKLPPDDSFTFRRDLGALLLNMGETDKALFYLMEALKLTLERYPWQEKTPEHDKLMRNIGIAFFIQGNYEKARVVFEMNYNKNNMAEKFHAALWLIGMDVVEGQSLPENIINFIKNYATSDEIKGDFYLICNTKNLSQKFKQGLVDALNIYVLDAENPLIVPDENHAEPAIEK